MRLGLKSLLQTTPASSPGGGTPALKFNVTTNSQYIPIVAF
jgi:hypothetical protein